MASATRAALELLLQAHRLDGTLPSALPATAAERIAATGVARLDALIDGGIPRGHLSELVGSRSSGRTGLLCRILAAATRRGEVGALVDTLDRFDPASGEAAGIDLSRLLWVRGTGLGTRDSGLETDIGRGLKALNLVLRSGGFGIVAIDLADVAPRVLRQIPYTTWMRLQRVIEATATACLVIADEPVARSSAGLTLVMRARNGRWVGRHARARVLDGIDIAVHVARARFRQTDERELELTMAGPADQRSG